MSKLQQWIVFAAVGIRPSSPPGLPALVRSLTGAAATPHVDLVSIAPGSPAALTPTVTALVVAPSPSPTPSTPSAVTLAPTAASASPLQ